MITLTRAMITQKGYPQIAQIAQITEGWGRHPATVRRHPDYISPMPHPLDRVGVGTVRRQADQRADRFDRRAHVGWLVHGR
jgi:hypothetical protein